MKRLTAYGATLLVVGAAAIVSGQTEAPGDSGSSSSYIQTSKLVGTKVRSSRGEEIGVIKDVVIDRSNGCMAYTVLSTSGEGTGVPAGGKIVAVPWAVYSPTPDLRVLRVNVGRDKIYNAPAFEYTRMDEYARPDYIDNVYSYFGVSPGPRTTVSASGGGTPGTDVTGTAGATASPGEVASSSARTQSDSAAGPDSDSSENLSPKTKPKASTTRAQPTKGRGEIGSPVTSEESASESTTSRNENKKSQRKAVEGSSAPRRTATPEAADDED
jgi:sporulation protein YlmC with PRC-barrel domain